MRLPQNRRRDTDFAMAIANDFLVDVTAAAHNAGFIRPVAITQALWSLVTDIPPAKRKEN